MASSLRNSSIGDFGVGGASVGETPGVFKATEAGAAGALALVNGHQPNQTPHRK